MVTEEDAIRYANYGTPKTSNSIVYVAGNRISKAI